MEKWDNSRSGFPAITSPHTFHSSSGSLAMLAAMRRASSRLACRLTIEMGPAPRPDCGGPISVQKRALVRGTITLANHP